MLRDLIAAEWLKLTRRPLIWVLLAIFLGLLLLQFATQFVFASLVSRGGDGRAVSAQVAEYQRRTALPGVIGMALGHVNGLGGIFAVILAAGALGSEYSWGTLRTMLARRPERSAFLLAKLAAIMLLLLAATLLTVAIALPLGWLGGAIMPGGDAGSLGTALLALPVAVLRALFVLLPYVLMTLCFTIAGRSLLAGAAGGLVYLVLEGGLGGLALIAELGEGWQAAYNLTIGQNINTLAIQNSHDFGLRPELITPVDLATLPPPWQATLVVLVYSLSFLGSALLLLRRRDVGGAG